MTRLSRHDYFVTKLILSPVMAMFIAPATILSTCKAPSKSKMEEAIDAINDPGIFQAKKFPYIKLKKPDYLSGSLAEQPWSDTYWPLNEAELAHRWIDSQIKFD